MTGTSQADINNKVDALLAARQAKLALALWELDSALATRYADVLRGIKMPLGLSEVEKRTAFLQEIERREGKGASVPAQDAARKGEPEAKKRAYNPFNNHEQRRFAELWVATRDEQGRSPYARNFLAENAEELKKIRVVTVKDVERIRDAVSKRGLLPRWNRPRKRRKSGGKYRQ